MVTSSPSAPALQAAVNDQLSPARAAFNTKAPDTDIDNSPITQPKLRAARILCIIQNAKASFDPTFRVRHLINFKQGNFILDWRLLGPFHQKRSYSAKSVCHFAFALRALGFVGGGPAASLASRSALRRSRFLENAFCATSCSVIAVLASTSRNVLRASRTALVIGLGGSNPPFVFVIFHLQSVQGWADQADVLKLFRPFEQPPLSASCAMASRSVLSLAPSGNTIGSSKRRDQDTTQLRKQNRDSISFVSIRSDTKSPGKGRAFEKIRLEEIST